MAKSLVTLSTKRLVARFAAVCEALYAAELRLEIGRYHVLSEELKRVAQEMKRRPNDHRRKLASLYGHSNINVRFYAALHSIAANPEKARETLREVAGKAGYPQAIGARRALKVLDEEPGPRRRRARKAEAHDGVAGSA